MKPIKITLQDLCETAKEFKTHIFTLKFAHLCLGGHTIERLYKVDRGNLESAENPNNPDLENWGAIQLNNGGEITTYILPESFAKFMKELYDNGIPLSYSGKELMKIVQKLAKKKFK